MKIVKQIGGTHYARYGELQHWDVVAHFELNYLVGNATRYLFRYKEKGGIQDLEKAISYIEKEIELMKEAQKRDLRAISIDPGILDDGEEAGAGYVSQE